MTLPYKRGARAWLPLAVACVLATLGLAGSVPERAEAYRLGGQTWPKRVITYRVTVPSFRQPVNAALAQWNASGVRLRFREVRSGKADVIVKTLRVPRLPPGVIALNPCGLGGAAGRGSLGYSRSFQANVWLDRNCSPQTLVLVAAHEFGHVMGLNHTSARCAVMTASNGGCADERRKLPWEYTCQVLRPDDVAGAIRRYGGRMRPMPANRTCLGAPTPGPVSGLTVEPNPVGSIATTRLTWQNPSSGALRRIVVRRNQGACPNLPSVPGRFVSIRSGLTPVHGDLVADVPAQGTTQATVTDIEPMASGRTCYAVWAVGPDDRYLDGVSATVDHPGTASDTARIGLVAQAAPSPDVAARLTWNNPTDQGLGDVRILSSNGPCPAAAAEFFGAFAGTVPSTPGPATFDHVTFAPDGPRCYAVEFRRADGYLARANTFLVQVG